MLPLRLLSFACLGGLCAAQSAIYPLEESLTIDWPVSAYPGAVGRTVVGEFTGDRHPDALVIAGSTAVIVYGAALYRAFAPLPVLANDAAAYPALAGGGRDSLVVVGPDGLTLLTNYDAGQFDVNPIETSTWRGAKRVLVSDVDGDGSRDAVGIDAMGGTLLLALDVSGGAPGFSQLPLNGSAFDLVTIDWAGAPAIAVLTDNGLFLQRWDGTQAAPPLPGAIDAGALAVLGRVGVGYERLVGMFRSGASDALLLYDPFLVEPSVVLPGGSSPYALHAGDADGDGDDDVLVSHTFSHQGLVLFNSRVPGATFDLASGDVVDYGPGVAPAPDQTAHAVFHDFSNDGDEDILVLLASTNQVVVMESSVSPRVEKQAFVKSGAYHYDEGLELGTLKLEVQVPPTTGFTPTHVQVIGWTQPDFSASADPVAAFNQFAALDANLLAKTNHSLFEPKLATLKLYHLDVRAVALAGQQIVDAGPSSLWSFATSGDDVSQLESAYSATGVTLRVFLKKKGPSGKKAKKIKFVEIELGEQELFERSLDPSTVEGKQIPPQDLPPDPFG